MRLPWRITRLLLAAAVVIAAGLAVAGPAGASPGTGWVRLAHLSPNAPAVDVYLYNFGNPDARLVLHHVSYGTVSPYEQVPDGDYTVSTAPRPARSPLPWLAVIAAGCVLTGAGARRYRRARIAPAP